MPATAAIRRARAAPVHAALGAVDRVAVTARVRDILPLLRVLLCERGVVLGDRETHVVARTRTAGPAEAGLGPYCLYRREPC